MTIIQVMSQLAMMAQSPHDFLDKLLDLHDEKVFKIQNLNYPSDKAEERATFTSDIPESDFMINKFTMSEQLKVAPTMMRLIYETQKSSEFYEKPFHSTQNEASAEFITGLESLAKEKGATTIRYIKVPGDSIFKGKAIPQQYAIIFAVKMDKAALDTAPSFECFHEVNKGYMWMSMISNAISKHLRDNGYAAYPGTALGGLTDYPRLAELAGMGTIGYHGLLITPEDGTLLRLNTVYTNIRNLPIQEENPHKWVRDFCAKCNKCIRACPVKAIFKEPQPQSNGRVHCIDSKACLDYFSSNYGCAICADVCPFSQIGYEAVKARYKGNPDAPQFEIPTIVT